MAGLVAVAAMGAVASLVFERILGGAAELTIFFGLVTGGLSASEEAIRQAATDTAFVAIAYCNAGLCLVSALVAWLTLKCRT